MAFSEFIKKQALECYLTGKTLEQTATLFKVHRNTIHRWHRAYEQHGWNGLAGQGQYPKKLTASTDARIVALKELRPAITIRKARDLLRGQSIFVSQKSIWKTWQRYGLGGFAKEQLSRSYAQYLNSVMPPVLTGEIDRLVDAGKYRKAADIINGLPVFPQNEIILKIPEHLLSLRRRVDRLQIEFARIPLKTYIRKAERLRGQLEKKKLYYSSLWVCVAECYAHMWAGATLHVLGLLKLMRKRTKGLWDARLRFIMIMLEGQAQASLLHTEKAMLCAGKMKQIIRGAKDPHFFMGGLGGLYSLIGYFRESIKWTRKALLGAAPSYQQQLHVNLAGFYTTSGEYQMALESLKNGKLEDWGFHSRTSMIKACAYLDQGNFGRAIDEASETLGRAEKEGVRRLLHPATLIQACCHQAADDKKEASRILREVLPLLKKYDLKLEYYQRRMIIGRARISKKLLNVPSLRLIYLLQKSIWNCSLGNYRVALKYARTQKLLGLFMRLVPFFPQPVRRLLEKGKNTGLPQQFLHMPVFQFDIPVYNIRYLGRLHIARRGKPLPGSNLRPKDAAFLIYLAGNKARSKELESLYRNFWPGRKEPARNLSHLLSRLRRALGIPAHLVKMKGGYLRWDVFFTTDLELFYELLSRAAAYAQAGEWKFATSEYRRAFRLCRGIPFKSMYDNWSEDSRHAFLNRLESAITGFAESCRNCGDMVEYNRVFENLVAKKLLPGKNE
ncbi:MAG TPA: helix-turn-helix domain-containing protein [bacterium]